MGDDIENELRKELDRTIDDTRLKGVLQAALAEIRALRAALPVPKPDVLGEVRSSEAPDEASIDGETGRLVPRNAPKTRR